VIRAIPTEFWYKFICYITTNFTFNFYHINIYIREEIILRGKKMGRPQLYFSDEDRRAAKSRASKKYYAAHREERLQYTTDYNITHRKEKLKKRKEYYYAHREKELKQRSESYYRHKDRAKKNHDDWINRNRDKWNIYQKLKAREKRKKELN
jgi:hypothetical protein